ncbi:ABC transporter ATP-binding protein [Myxococcota bacterium]|nr:ABC transporter ATP-binding protein [Myxococcota bacterium]
MSTIEAPSVGVAPRTRAPHSEPSPRAAVLSARGVVRSYGAMRAVDGVDLELFAGELVALVGPNGAGKTSLFAMLSGLVAPDAGTIDVLGERGLFERRGRIGHCPQQPIVWADLTPREQLVFVGELFGRTTRDARARAAVLLRDVGLEAKADALAATLSGGMTRRLNLALALVHEPPILILDEPTANLDLDSRHLVHALLSRLVRDEGKCVLLATHDVTELERLADRIAVMDRGRLLALGTAEALITESRGTTERTSAPGAPSTAHPATIELTFPHDGPALHARAVAMVDALGVPASWDGERVRLAVPSVTSHVAIVAAALERAGLVPREVVARERTIEDAILAILGRRAR